jgi:hypothetical protein
VPNRYTCLQDPLYNIAQIKFWIINCNKNIISFLVQLSILEEKKWFASFVRGIFFKSSLATSFDYLDHSLEHRTLSPNSLSWLSCYMTGLCLLHYNQPIFCFFCLYFAYQAEPLETLHIILLFQWLCWPSHPCIDE